MDRRLRSVGLLGLGLVLLAGCSTHHWAEVKVSKLPPPPIDRVLHSGRLILEVTDKTEETQCVVHEHYSPVCFYNLRPAVEQGLVRGLWPSYPDVELGTAADARPGDYLLQVEFELDALPPDNAGPGWSAGVRGRYRLMRDGQTLREATLASRSRADLPYGAPLGLGATDVVDAALIHITTDVSGLPETRPDEPVPLPVVAANVIVSGRKTEVPASAADPSLEEATDEATKLDDSASDSQAKTLPTASFATENESDGDTPPPPPSLAK